MKVFGFLSLIGVTMIMVVASCTVPPPPAAQETGMITPGDRIGDMIIEQGTEHNSYPVLWNFCEFLFDSEPGTDSVNCYVPPLPELVLILGWGAEESLIDSNWDAMNYELFIDDHKVDLEAFDWVEMDNEYRGSDVKTRNWFINLEGMPLGEHTIHYWWSSETPVDDGFDVYQPGKYEHVVNFTVGENKTYLPINSGVNAGLHPYSSRRAGLDYWLYVPAEYIKDTEKTWPLIMYLHGTLPGTDLRILEEEVLLQKLADESDFPFIVVAPRAEGENEFWAKEEMINSLDGLLEEIQTRLPVDPQRIYLTGSSAGGNGTWALGLTHPERFAALAPVMGYYGWPFAVPENICDLEDVPVWAFHGANDEILPLEADQMLVDALEACGGNIEFTVYPDAGHAADQQAYAGSELYDWFLAHSLE